MCKINVEVQTDVDVAIKINIKAKIPRPINGELKSAAEFAGAGDF